jgi:hypothetical protein
MPPRYHQFTECCMLLLKPRLSDRRNTKMYRLCFSLFQLILWNFDHFYIFKLQINGVLSSQQPNSTNTSINSGFD